jgi:serine/threonine protein kinase
MSSEEQLVPGMQIKNYILEEQLGKGASGEVWKANDGMKTVALKLMNPQLLTSRNVAKHLERMEREISALGRLQSHPNIPSIFDYDLNYERPYMAMQFIGGASYEKLIKSGDMLRIPLNNRLRMIRELAMALAAAHRENIIHRDIKPANASGTENPYLLDFSVALPEEDLQKTQANIGTKLYMPWDGIPDKLGDIYSFGLLAYEIIFGRHAIFRPEDNAMLKATPFMPQVVAGERIKNREWHVPSKLSLDEVPADLVGKDLHPLDDVFQKVLGSRTQRYEDPRTFAEDLRRAIEEGLAPPQYPDNVVAAAPAPAAPPPPVQPPPASPPVQPPPEPVRAEPPAPVPPDVVEDAATVVEDLSIASTPHESHIPPDDVQPTVVEPPAAPPASSVTMPPDDFDGGKTVLDMPAAPRPTPPPASQPPMPVRQEPPPEPPRRPPSLEPERPVPAPPMPAQPEILVGTQLEAEPPRPASSRSPVVFVVAGVAAFFLLGIIAVLLISGNQQPPENPTVTPGEVIQEVTAEPTTEVPTLVALVATEVLQTATPTEIPPTATRRPTDTPVPVTETPVPTDTPMPPTETPLPTDTPVPPTATVEPPTATIVAATDTSVPPTDTAVPPTETPVPPTNTPLPTDTTEPPTVTPLPTDTPIPATETPLPTDTPVPPTATRVPSSTPTPIPPTATRRPTEAVVIAQVDATATEAVPTEIAASPTPSLIPPTATRIGDEATPTPDVPTPTPTPEGLSANLGDNIRLLRAAILGDRYQCSVFNDVYEHLQTRLNGDFEDNAAYERYGNDILREMARIYRGFCRTRDTDDERLPRRYEEDNSDLDVLLDDILDALALTATPTLTPTP